jgi:hypothetical protein
LIDVGRIAGLCRVASRNSVTSCLTEDVTRHFCDEPLNGLLSPRSHSFLQGIYSEGQEAHQDERLDAVGVLVPDGAHAQLILLDAERGLGLVGLGVSRRRKA